MSVQGNSPAVRKLKMAYWNVNSQIHYLEKKIAEKKMEMLKIQDEIHLEENRWQRLKE